MVDIQHCQLQTQHTTHLSYIRLKFNTICRTSNIEKWMFNQELRNGYHGNGIGMCINHTRPILICRYFIVSFSEHISIQVEITWMQADLAAAPIF